MSDEQPKTDPRDRLPGETQEQYDQRLWPKRWCHNCQCKVSADFHDCQNGG